MSLLVPIQARRSVPAKNFSKRSRDLVVCCLMSFFNRNGCSHRIFSWLQLHDFLIYPHAHIRPRLATGSSRAVVLNTTMSGLIFSGEHSGCSLLACWFSNGMQDRLGGMQGGPPQWDELLFWTRTGSWEWWHLQRTLFSLNPCTWQLAPCCWSRQTGRTAGGLAGGDSWRPPPPPPKSALGKEDLDLDLDLDLFELN